MKTKQWIIHGKQIAMFYLPTSSDPYDHEIRAGKDEVLVCEERNCGTYTEIWIVRFNTVKQVEISRVNARHATEIVWAEEKCNEKGE